MPAVDAPDPGGIAFAELEMLLAGLVDTPHCLGVELTVFDPDYDPDGAYAAEIVNTVVAGLAPVAAPDAVPPRLLSARPTPSPRRGNGRAATATERPRSERPGRPSTRRAGCARRLDRAERDRPKPLVDSAGVDPADADPATSGLPSRAGSGPPASVSPVSAVPRRPGRITGTGRPAPSLGRRGRRSSASRSARRVGRPRPARRPPAPRTSGDARRRHGLTRLGRHHSRIRVAGRSASGARPGPSRGRVSGWRGRGGSARRSGRPAAVLAPPFSTKTANATSPCQPTNQACVCAGLSSYSAVPVLP